VGLQHALSRSGSTFAFPGNDVSEFSAEFVIISDSDRIAMSAP